MLRWMSDERGDIYDSGRTAIFTDTNFTLSD